MQWIKEVEMVDPLDDLKTSFSIRGIRTPDFEVLDAKIASALNRIIHNSHFRRTISLEEQKAQKEDRFLRIRESEKFKTVLELYDLEIDSSEDAGHDFHRLKTMVKRSIEQEIRNKNFGSRNGNFDRNAVVKNQGTKQRGQRILGDCWQWETDGQCSKGDICSFRHDDNKRAKMTQPNPSPSSFMQQDERKASRTRSPRRESPSGRMSRWPCKDYLKGTCNNSFCEKWHPPECLYYKTKSGCRFGEKCSFANRQVDAQPTKWSKSNDDKSAVTVLKKCELHDRTEQPIVDRDTLRESNHGPVGCSSSNTRQLGCVFQDMEPPKLTSILRKRSDMQKPIRRVRFTKAIARHTQIRDKSLARIDLPR